MTRAVIQAVWLAGCTLGMALLWAFIHWMVYGFSRDFGLGFALGGVSMLMLGGIYVVLDGRPKPPRY